MEFTGPARRFTDGAIAQAAAELGADIAAVRAVISVESNGGFLPDTRPKILFERHLFHRLTDGRFSGTHPGISSPTPGGYAGGAREYERLGEAMALDRAAALKAASWGAFQILGRNHEAAGFDDVEAFVAAMTRSEDDHLHAFVAFVKANRLDDELCRRDWAGFARGYNGPNFRINRYDEKLAAAYLHHSIVSPRAEPAVVRTLKMGDAGPDVAWLQQRLGLTADGDFGPATKRAVIAFQAKNRLQADGIAGPRTLARLRG
ncbi:MAG: N-acetylmuramidase domain-containing protein [Allosphingosinicella sp.]